MLRARLAEIWGGWGKVGGTAFLAESTSDIKNLRQKGTWHSEGWQPDKKG